MESSTHRDDNDKVAYGVNRVAIDVGQTFDQFLARYEKAVPELDRETIASLMRRNAGWDAIVADANAAAKHGFFIFWKMDVMPLMHVAGHSGRCVQYLTGNHTIAERMFRHDPLVMLYAPLRVLIYDDSAGATRFAIDQPSTVFSSFGNPAIAEVGRELDDKVLALLADLGVQVSPGIWS